MSGTIGRRKGSETMALVIEYHHEGKLLRRSRVTDRKRNIISIASSGLQTCPAYTEAQIRDERGSLLSTIVSNNFMVGMKAY